VENLDWQKSSYSMGSGNCVEGASAGDRVLLRDSKNPDGEVMSFPKAEFAAFIKGIKAGEFDSEETMS
jgi:hypothetical protein